MIFNIHPKISRKYKIINLYYVFNKIQMANNINYNFLI